MNFGVDHYRPQSISQFAHLKCDYRNLYYCCGNCNSRKKDAWPIDEKVGPYVINPCDHVMADHLRFDAVTASVAARSPWGMYTRDLLQLDERDFIALRKSSLQIARLCERELELHQKNIRELQAKLKKGQISKAVFNKELADIQIEILDTQRSLDRITGSAPLPRLPKSRLGVAL